VTNRLMKMVDGELMPLSDADLAQRRIDEANTARPIAVTLSALAFMERFTPAERLVIRSAARAPGGEALEDWLDLLRAAQIVDLRDARTVAGLAALVQAGLISDARREQILGATAGEDDAP
jgi:hypothetical protein